MKSRMPLVVAGTALVVVAPLVALSTQAQAAPQRVAAAPKTTTATPTTTPTATPTTTPTTPPTGEPTSPAPTETPAPTDPGTAKWTPETGVIFNEPRQSEKSHKINKHIRLAINRARKGSQIRLVTWNFSSQLYVGDLIRAHKRGISVRIIMANGLAEDQGANGYYGRTKAALEKGNKKRPQDMTSWFRTCKNSCRGKEGIQHGKWFMFSRTGGRSNVVMSTSANLTDAAAYVQWNDMFTVVNDQGVWDNYTKVFSQMAKDKPQKKPFYTFTSGRYDGWFNPNVGAPKKFMAHRVLDKVRCKGAVGDAGKNGRTVIWASQAVFNRKIGTAMAAKLRNLKKRGCQVRLVYGVLNRLASEHLSSVPKRMILEDTNGDGYVDRYLHMKAMTISGVYDGKRSAHVVYQGSANWSGMSTLSDEQGFVVRSQELEEDYSRFMRRLYKNPPPQGVDLIKEIVLRQRAGHDPFAQVREEMGMGSMKPAL